MGFLCQESDVKLNNKPAARLFRTSWNTYDEFVFPKEVLVKKRTEWSFIFFLFDVPTLIAVEPH